MWVIAQELVFIQTLHLHNVDSTYHYELCTHFSGSIMPFFAVSKILVSTGSPRNSATKTTEIINLNNENLTCQDLEDYPLKISGAVGVNMGSSPVICEGWTGSKSVNQCHRLVAGRWQHFANITQRYILYLLGLH